MTLCPADVNFEDTWGKIKYTIERVLAWLPVPKRDWNDRFSYPFHLNID